jgi:hypothetical protein
VLVGPADVDCVSDTAPPADCAIRERTLKLTAPPR